ncbi:MAG: glycogen debranching protein GlgX [Gemmataceae bacterium]
MHGQVSVSSLLEQERGQSLPVARLVSPSPAFKTSRGSCRPFGAVPRADGVNFAIFSRHAQAVSLVLFRDGREDAVAEIPLDPFVHKTGDVWHVFVHGLTSEYLYGYRVHGPNTAKSGHRFDASVVLLDPYARSLSGNARWGHPDVPHGQPTDRLTRRSRIVAGDFNWEGDKPPTTPISQTVLYELHVRGFTRHASSGVAHPGTYLGLIEKIPYLQSLGVTAVQLMPVMEFDELEHAHRSPHVGEPLLNYWGYSPLSFFAPKAAYAARAGQQVREFKHMVKAFHKAGLEVILDVVYNHTREGNENGPTLNFRGLDNTIYYMLDKEGRYYNFSGCGNTLNCNHPLVRDLILDSLVEWVTEMHVDGFRFDLAAILGRGANGKVLDDPPLLQHIAEHPLLSGTKLIAEAWDAAGLSRIGKFPAWGRWAELNGMYRDDVRRFLRGDADATANVAKRISGSLDLYGDAPRHCYHSVNFITCHDGFTLNDLVSYNGKHNEANGENNRDGWDANFCCNFGHEGPTDNGFINAVRQRQMRNYFTMLLISQGVPFLSHGDEFARTQRGNNNAYCQDNDISWVDWSLTRKNAGLVRFTRKMIDLRKRCFAHSQDQFVNRVSWHGVKLGDPDWTGQSRTLAFHLHGWRAHPPLYVLFNAHWESQRFDLPPHNGPWRWKRLVDTNLPSPDDIVEEQDAVALRPEDHYIMSPRSAVILIGSR